MRPFQIILVVFFKTKVIEQHALDPTESQKTANKKDWNHLRNIKTQLKASSVSRPFTGFIHVINRPNSSFINFHSIWCHVLFFFFAAMKYKNTRKDDKYPL